MGERRGQRTIWSHALHEEREGLPSWQMEEHEERVEQVECEHGCGSLWKGAWTGSPCGGASGLSCLSCALGMRRPFLLMYTVWFMRIFFWGGWWWWWLVGILGRETKKRGFQKQKPGLRVN